MSNGKLRLILLMELYRTFRGNTKAELDLFSYATKTDLNNVTGIDTSKLAAKSDLASLKSELDRIDVRKL